MTKEIYVIGDESRPVVKNILVQLQATKCTIHVIAPVPERLVFDTSRQLQIVLCLFEGMDFEVVRKLGQIQKSGNINIYTIGTINMTVDQDTMLRKIPAVRFPSYTFNTEEFISTLQKNDITDKHILVVDDEPILLRSIKSWLGDEFEISLVNSGEAALQYLSSHSADLVLLDYKMPGMDGPEVLKKIRSNVSLAQLPVIFLTANNDKESVMTVMNLKPEGYILKSKSPTEIKQAVIDFFKSRL
jgi:CheY-like chemotaxis protein